MSLRFYMDHNVQLAITLGLRRRGIECLTAEDDGAEEWDDGQILQRATDLGRVLFTEDVDFLAIAEDWLDRQLPFGGVIFGRQLRITIGQAIRDLELFAQTCDDSEMRNKIEHIPL